MKKLCAILILAIICIFGITFSACKERVIFPSSFIMLAMVLDSDGSVTQDIEFSLQSENLKHLNTPSEHVNEIKNNFVEAMNMLRNEFYISFLLIYTLVPDPQFAISQNVAVGQVEIDKQADIIHFCIKYKNLKAYQYYQGAALSNNQSNPESNLLGKNNVKFVTRQQIEGLFPFAAPYTDAAGNKITVGQRYQSLYRNCFNVTLPNDVVGQLDVPKFVYDYALPYSNIRSNSSTVVHAGNLYHNIWIKDVNNYQDQKIKLTSTTVNAGLWYLTLLVATIFAFGVGLLIIKIKNRQKIQ